MKGSTDAIMATKVITKDPNALAIGLLVAILGSIVTTAWIGLQKLGSLDAQVQGVTSDVSEFGNQIMKVSDKLSNLVENDVGDLRRRISVLESLDILPRSDREIRELELRVRELEKQGRASD